MNKQTQAPKTRKGVYIKFTLLMIASALTGAFISIFLFGREDGLLQLTRRVSDGLILAGPWLLALGLVPTGCTWPAKRLPPGPTRTTTPLRRRTGG